jgi:two-component system nitrogen regulation sensor histidine kinase GlnL
MNLAVPGLDILATAVLLLDEQRIIRYLNPAAENLFGMSVHHAVDKPLSHLIRACPDLERAVDAALKEGASFTEHHLPVEAGDSALTLNVTVTPLEYEAGAVVLEFHPAGNGLKIARDEQAMTQAQTVQMLLRQLAHEIRNPLGGIRGAAQLLEAELNGASCRNTPRSSSRRPTGCRTCSIAGWPRPSGRRSGRSTCMRCWSGCAA